MKNYIKINNQNYIIDFFKEFQTHKFDGTEIEIFEEMTNISDYFGNYIYQYINKKIVLNPPLSQAEIQAEIDKKQALQTLAKLDRKLPRGTEDLFEKVNKMRDTVILILTKLEGQGLITNSKLIELTDSMVIGDDFIDIYTAKKAERLKL